jgi:hypothetical protein
MERSWKTTSISSSRGIAVAVMSRDRRLLVQFPSVALADGHYTKDLNIGNNPVDQWFPNNIRGEIRIRKPAIHKK